MKKIAYWEDKAKKIWEERGIDMEELANLIEHKEYIKEYGVDMPEIVNWKWTKK